jgi:hypothetical protein
VLRTLRELAPLSAIRPVTLREVRDVLTPRHRRSPMSLEQAWARVRRHACRCPRRSFRVFVPGLAERMFPQRIREDALPPARREATDSALATQPEGRRTNGCS